MKKATAISIETGAVIVISICVLAGVLGLFFYSAGPAKWSSIWQIFNQISGEYNNPAADKLDAAIKCVMYSCTTGCDATEIQDLVISVDGKDQTCKEICLSKQKDGRMCGKESAIKAEVSNSAGEVISYKDTSFACLMPASGCSSADQGGTVNIQKDIFKANTVSPTDADCNAGKPIDKAVVISGTYYVWAVYSNNFLYPGASGIVCSSQTSSVVGDCNSVGGTCRTACFNDEKPIQGRCFSEHGVNTCCTPKS